jgi:hypothetical protein
MFLASLAVEPPLTSSTLPLRLAMMRWSPPPAGHARATGTESGIEAGAQASVAGLSRAAAGSACRPCTR